MRTVLLTHYDTGRPAYYLQNYLAVFAISHFNSSCKYWAVYLAYRLLSFKAVKKDFNYEYNSAKQMLQVMCELKEMVEKEADKRGLWKGKKRQFP